MSKTRTTPLHPQSVGMVERYIKTAGEQLRKVVASNQKDWEAMLSLFLLAYRASTHDTTGFTAPQNSDCPAIYFSGHLPTRSGQQSSMRQNLVDHLRDIQNYARQHMRLFSNRMKTRYDKLAKCAGYMSATECGYIVRPAQRGSHPSFNTLGRTHTR
jgi:hypothetical protein